MVLRDSFIGQGENISVGMIACVSPGYSHADHTLNTIWYAARLKEFSTDEKEKVTAALSMEEQKVQFGKWKATTSGDTKWDKPKESLSKQELNWDLWDQPASPTKISYETKVVGKVDPTTQLWKITAKESEV